MNLAAQVDELDAECRELERENVRLRHALREIADASGWDNIGRWARNRAKHILANTQDDSPRSRG